MKATNMTEEVTFWKWINNKILAVVTETNVYHWNIETQDQPQLVRLLFLNKYFFFKIDD